MLEPNLDSRSWANLPGHLLVEIIMKLTVMDYFAFAGVCKDWRAEAIREREKFMKIQLPLVFFKSPRASKTCFLFNIFDETRYKTMLPDLKGKYFLGLSCGYLITICQNSELWLVNLLTRHELHLLALPKDNIKFDVDLGRPILFRSSQAPGIFMIIVYRLASFALLSQSGATNWELPTLLPKSCKHEGIVDLNILNGKIYVLTLAARIIKLTMNPRGKLEISNSISIDWWNSSMELMTSDKGLCVVDAPLEPMDYRTRKVKIYQLDDKTMELVQTEDLSGNALFLSHVKGCTFINMTNWKAHENSVYILVPKERRYWEFSFSRRYRSFKFPATLRDTLIPKVVRRYLEFSFRRRYRSFKFPATLRDTLVPHFWYFPQTSFEANLVDELFDGEGHVAFDNW